MITQDIVRLCNCNYVGGDNEQRGEAAGSYVTWTSALELQPNHLHNDREGPIYKRNSTCRIKIGQAKTGWGTTETGFASPILILQVLFLINMTNS